MFVPPYQLLLDELRGAASRPRTADDVTLPKAVFNLMLRLLVGKMPFDEAQYLRRNEDISGAMQQAKKLMALMNILLARDISKAGWVEVRSWMKPGLFNADILIG
jgi:hypothetical protein